MMYVRPYGILCECGSDMILKPHDEPSMFSVVCMNRDCDTKGKQRLVKLREAEEIFVKSDA